MSTPPTLANLPSAASTGPVQPWRWLYRVPALLVAAVCGLPVLLLALVPGLRDIPLGTSTLGASVQRGYARVLIAALGMRLEIYGTPPPAPVLVVANHISWFDILLLHALAPMWLVAKADIRAWPLVGWLARAVGTIFIARGNDGSRRRTGRRMAALLSRGRNVGVFPEAGIDAGRGVGRFHARLFGPALRMQVAVVPVAIRYWRDGDIHDERVFAPGVGFLPLAVSCIARPPCRAQVFVGRPIATAGLTRAEVARLAHQEVVRMYAHGAD
ncbi:MAG: lysophospholipid acyltransferase family protein [Wenzhouxiangellaceae bacterium]